MKQGLCLAVASLMALIGARSSSAACTAVTSVPTTISEAGSYYLTADIAARSMTGILIWIKASDVRLDLGDRKIVGPGGSTEASAIVNDRGLVSAEWVAGRLLEGTSI